MEAAARRLERSCFSTMLPWLYFARCHAAVTRALTCFLPYPVEFQALSLRIGQGPILIRHEADRRPRSLLLAPLPCSGGGADPPGVSNQTPAAPAQESLTLPFRVIVIFPSSFPAVFCSQSCCSGHGSHHLYFWCSLTGWEVFLLSVTAYMSSVFLFWKMLDGGGSFSRFPVSCYMITAK